MLVASLFTLTASYTNSLRNTQEDSMLVCLYFVLCEL